MEKSPMPYPVIQHFMASPSTVAWIMHQKFVNALPLYRQEKEWLTLGVNLSLSTMSNWILAASRDWLTPLVELMHTDLLNEKYLHADETKDQVMNEEGRKNTTDSYMWCTALSCTLKNLSGYFSTSPVEGINTLKNFSKSSKGIFIPMHMPGIRKLLISQGAYVGVIFEGTS